MKNFYGSIFISRDKLEEAGINYPIKVEYYKITEEEKRKTTNEAIYGVQIIKTGLEEVIIELEKIQRLAKNEKMSYNT